MFLLLLADKQTNKQTSQRKKKYLLRDTSDSVPWEIHEISSMIICVIFSRFLSFPIKLCHTHFHESL